VFFSTVAGAAWYVANQICVYRRPSRGGRRRRHYVGRRDVIRWELAGLGLKDPN
jgi:hypothetical protein